MTKNLKAKLIDSLWRSYVPSIPYYDSVFKNKTPVLDHFAIIDLPQSPNSGRSFLKSIFERLGFIHAGSGYLPDKKNDFMWYRDIECSTSEARNSLPQAVLADFRLELHSKEVQKIVTKYMDQVKPFDFDCFDTYLRNAQEQPALEMIEEVFKSRAWDLPTVEEYNAIKAENPLLAWVVLFGRKVNHFGVNIIHEDKYSDLVDFNLRVKSLQGSELNLIEGEVKGGEHDGIAQSSTLGESITVRTKDGHVTANNSFMEFVWRYPLKENPVMWNDYFTGFVAQNANYVVESLYDRKQ